MGTKTGPKALERRSVVALPLCALPAAAAVAQVPQTAPPPKPGEKVFKYAFLIAETGFDGVQLSDLYSRIVTSNIFEAPLAFDYLDMDRVVPLTAAALPEVTNDFKTWTIRIKPGIYFADDPAFGGKKRELTAADYVYAFKRHYDPKNKSPNLYFLENAKVIGLSEIRKRIMDAKQPFPYDEPAEGIKLIDKYTFQFNFGEPQPRFDQSVLCDSSVWGAVAKEVVDKYGDKIMEHPVGTGPFMLSAWRRSSRMVFVKNPNFREEFYPTLEGKQADEPRFAEYAKKFAGRKLPMVDRVEVSIIEESQPRWLAFMNNETDMVTIPGEYINLALPNNELAPNLQKKGVKRFTLQRPDVAMSFFNMQDALVGGYEPHKVALRRAIALAQDESERKRAIYRNQAVISQGFIPHATFAYDPSLRTEMSVFDLPKAKALLDTYGYLDKDGDGWREQPDGKPLVIEYSSQPDSTSRQMQELWKKSMDRLGIKMVFKIAKWPEQLKNSRAGKLQMWGVGWVGSTPDSDTFLALGYGPNIGGANHARFNLPAYNEIYQKTRVMGDGPERAKLMQQAAALAVAYMPYKIHVHRYETQITQPWVDGWRFHPYMRDNWKMVDVNR